MPTTDTLGLQNSSELLPHTDSAVKPESLSVPGDGDSTYAAKPVETAWTILRVKRKRDELPLDALLFDADKLDGDRRKRAATSHADRVVSPIVKDAPSPGHSSRQLFRLAETLPSSHPLLLPSATLALQDRLKASLRRTSAAGDLSSAPPPTPSCSDAPSRSARGVLSGQHHSAQELRESRVQKNMVTAKNGAKEARYRAVRRNRVIRPEDVDTLDDHDGDDAGSRVSAPISRFVDVFDVVKVATGTGEQGRPRGLCDLFVCVGQRA
ncbi:hypothetical protein HDU93_004153 [Gonapodya sp. JEL0774]|nr:hypothetical protein HDU93_004153 [Gonapodya sp. JEL0774]